MTAFLSHKHDCMSVYQVGERVTNKQQSRNRLRSGRPENLDEWSAVPGMDVGLAVGEGATSLRGTISRFMSSLVDLLEV